MRVRALEQVAPKGCRVSIFGDTEMPTGLGLGQLALVDCALHRVGLGGLQDPIPGLGASVISFLKIAFKRKIITVNLFLT